MKTILLTGLLFFCTGIFAATYYISPTGSDANTGTSLASPYFTISKAVSKVVAGDFIFVRGGTYNYTAKVNIAKNGTAANKIYLLVYPGDARPVFNFSALANGTRGIEISGSYWYFKGFDVYKAGDNGMHMTGSHNIIEFCAFYENGDTGFQLDGGASNNQIINCDSYYNRDSTSASSFDGNADGFAVKIDVGTGNSFKGCRSWQNSDDGWDGLLYTGTPAVATTYDSCWCFMNGYRKSGLASTGNGNGFKMGGNNMVHDATLTHCLSAFNRVKGFDQNNDNGSMILYNCTGYKNKPNFGMNNNAPDAGKVMIVKNCVSFSSGSTNQFNAAAQLANNSWQITPAPVTADFLSVDSTGIRGPRNADGSLPVINFMHLSATSNLIDKGVNVGLAYNGSAPDLGAFETKAPLSVSMLSFNAVLKNTSVQLNWIVNAELQNKGWQIEKLSASGFQWQAIGFVEGANTSSLTKEYSFNDADVKSGERYQYRLKQIDINGKFVYSNIIAIQLNNKEETKLNIYPNPVKSNATVSFQVNTKANIVLNVLNVSGQIVKILQNEVLEAGSYNKVYSFEGLKSGNYFLQLSVGNNKTVMPLTVDR